MALYKAGYVTAADLAAHGALRDRGTIAVSSDFPLAGSVLFADWYRVTANVVDNDPTRTNTGQSFTTDEEIYWTGTNWRAIGGGGGSVTPAVLSALGCLRDIGVILNASDFPTPASVLFGDLYRIESYVIDDDPSKTCTDQSFLNGEKIYWSGSYWEVIPARLYLENNLILWVDKSYTDGGSDGSFGHPYTSISDALTTIPDPANDPDQRRQYFIHIIGGYYDEDLTIPAARIIHLVAQGFVVLGDGSGPLYASTTPRNITWNRNSAKEIGSSRPSLVIESSMRGLTSSTHPAYINGFWISGNIAGSQTSENSVLDLQLNGVRVLGTVNLSAFTGHRVECCFISTYFGSTCNIGTVGRIIQSLDTEYNGLLTCERVCRVSENHIKAGMTLSGMTNDQPPEGFFNCHIAGTVTCAEAVWVDASTLGNASFSVSGGGSITRIDKASGVLNDSSVSGTTVKDALNTLLATVGVEEATVVIPTDGDWDSEAEPIFQNPEAGSITLVSVRHEVKGSSTPQLTFNIERRASGSLSVVGTDIFAADKTASGTGVAETVFVSSSVAANAFLVLTTGASAESGSVESLILTIRYTVD